MRASRLILAAALLAAGPCLAAGNAEPDRVQHWQELAGYLFGDGPIAPTESVVTLDAPTRALDSALVPVTLHADPDVTALSLVIDENPGPLAAAVTFGPAGDPRLFGLRVRIDGYTNVHAVATRADGSLVENAVFVKGAGGCSAPVGTSDAEAMAGIGEMRLKFGGDAPDGAARAQLMLRHPNFNGMQMNQVTMLYTPARYVTDIAVTRGGEPVFSMRSDISLATDPVIDFLYQPGDDAPFDVAVTDSKGEHWSGRFPAPQVGN